MNAVIALCHFCEAHGPCAVFCTQTLRDTNIESISLDHLVTVNCLACNSTGTATAIVSHDIESSANFVSTQVPVFSEVATLVKQASVRSLSCEITSNKDGGFVFFGDASRGHVLSHTFQISDVQARGFYQLFSIIILMKDKYFLLNIQPFLSENLKKISKELQCYAQKVYDGEQLKGSERERRLSENHSLPQSSRSLIELTAEQNIFAILHSHFTWLLLAGSRFLTEHVTFDHLPWIPSNNSLRILHLQKESLQHENVPALNLDNSINNIYSPRRVKEILGDDFVSACYCVVIGIKVIIRGPIQKCNAIAACFMTLLPNEMHNILKMNSPEELSNSDAKIITVPSEIAVPLPDITIFRVDILESERDVISIKWPGELPSKLPTLLRKIFKAVNEPLFMESVLEKHLNVLKEEWKNKIICLSRPKSTTDVKLKNVLGIQGQDMALVTYWLTYFNS